MKYEIETDEKWSMLNAIVGMVLRYVPGSVIEIGTSYGDSVKEKRKSTNIMGDHAIRFKRSFYTCDLRKKCVIDYPKHHHFIMPSFEFLPIVKKKMEEGNDFPAVIFIDGKHEYETIIEEVKVLFPLLTTHGVMFFHDTMPKLEKQLIMGACGTAYKVRQELETWCPEKADIFTWPYTAGRVGLSMLIKKETEREYFRK